MHLSSVAYLPSPAKDKQYFKFCTYSSAFCYRVNTYFPNPEQHVTFYLVLVLVINYITLFVFLGTLLLSLPQHGGFSHEFVLLPKTLIH